MRPLVYITVGYITGIIWGLYLKISIVPIFLIFGVIVFLYSKKIKKKIFIYLLLFSISSIISNTQINYLQEKHQNLYQGLEEIKLIGTIISDRKETNYKASYIVKVENIKNNVKYKGTKLLVYTSKDENLSYGDKVIFHGVYEKAKGRTNYKAFDYNEYLKGKGIYGIVTVDKVKIIKQENLNQVMIIFNNIRNVIKSNLRKILGEESKVTIGILLR